MRHPYPSRPKCGFTLIELLTVVAIIGILAAIIIPVVGKVRDSARTAGTVSNARQLATAVLLHLGDNRGEFPLANVNNAPAGQQYWPRRLAESVGLNPNASRGLFISPSDRVTRTDTNLGANAHVPTSFSAHGYLFGRGNYDAGTGTITRNPFPPVQRLNRLSRPSEIVMIITGEPLVNYNPATGLSDGATATFSHLPYTAWNAAAATLDNPLERLPSTNGWEQIGYYVGAGGQAVIDGSARSMSLQGRAVAGMVDGSVRQFRFGELKVRHVNLVH